MTDPPPTGFCSGCNQQFVRRKPTMLYCSHRCRQAGYRQRHDIPVTPPLAATASPLADSVRESSATADAAEAKSGVTLAEVVVMTQGHVERLSREIRRRPANPKLRQLRELAILLRDRARGLMQSQSREGQQ